MSALLDLWKKSNNFLIKTTQELNNLSTLYFGEYKIFLISLFHVSPWWCSQEKVNEKLILNFKASMRVCKQYFLNLFRSRVRAPISSVGMSLHLCIMTWKFQSDSLFTKHKAVILYIHHFDNWTSINLFFYPFQNSSYLLFSLKQIYQRRLQFVEKRLIFLKSLIFFFGVWTTSYRHPNK